MLHLASQSPRRRDLLTRLGLPFGRVDVDVPEVRAGVAAEGRLQVVLLDGNRRPLAELERPVFVFGRDPAAERKQWIEEMDLRLFDPEGATARRLDELEQRYDAQFRSVFDAIRALMEPSGQDAKRIEGFKPAR